MTDFVALMPFAQQLGIRITSAGKGEVVGHLDHAAEKTTAGDLLHGGAIMSLADSIGAVCAFLNLPDGATTSTTSSNTVFVRGVRGGTVTATAHPIHVGRTSINVVTELRDDQGRLVAQTTQTQAVLPLAAS